MDAYLFLAEFWEPGDRIYVFGAGCGAYCARALTRLLNIVGVLAPGCDELLQYVLENWALPHTHRTPQDWESLARLATRLFGLPDADIAVGVEYLGLWDTTKVPGLSRESAQHLDTDPLANVAAGRHAVAIDERRLPAREHLMSPAAAVEEVWFRGNARGRHRRVGRGRRPLAGIALDWVLEGAVRAGLRLADPTGAAASAPTEVDVLTDDHRPPAGTRFGIGLRSVPDEAFVHASVRVFLGRHPLYWHRLPAMMCWADPGWPARSERLVTAATGPLVTVPQRLNA